MWCAMGLERSYTYVFAIGSRVVRDRSEACLICYMIAQLTVRTSEQLQVHYHPCFLKAIINTLQRKNTGILYIKYLYSDFLFVLGIYKFMEIYLFLEVKMLNLIRNVIICLMRSFSLVKFN